MGWIGLDPSHASNKLPLYRYMGDATEELQMKFR
jgi:hypothetical protein